MPTTSPRTVALAPLEPRQQPTPRPLETAADFYQQHMLKHPYRSDFHAEAERLHAGLLEGDPAVSSYVPQPFRLRVGRRRYIPDCYVLRDGQRLVRELKPEGRLDAALRDPLTAFFSQQGMCFEVLANEALFERRTEAENWLDIVQTLYVGRDFDTAAAETDVLDTLAGGAAALGDLLDPGDRERTYLTELALFRLLHRGRVGAALADATLDYDTVFDLCA